MEKPTQDYRPIRMASEFGKDVLLFHSMSAMEQLGQPFEYRIHAFSTDANLDFNKIIGTPMSVCLDLPEGRKRYFNGWVSEFSQMPSEVHRYAAYQIVLRPWLWFLSHHADCRFFQDKTIPDILEDIFNDRSYKDYEPSKLKRADYPKREYCAQYRETDFSFVSRRMEEEGLYYYFEHTEDGKHILILADDPSDHSAADGYATLPFATSFQNSDPKHDAVVDWAVTHTAKPSGYALNSFYFEQPSNPLYKLVAPEAKYPKVQAVVYDYNAPDFYRDINIGERYAKIRLQELHAEQELIQVKTNAMGLVVGKTFTLTEHPREDQNREYLVTGSHITLNSDHYESISSGGAELSFSCELSLLDAKLPFRPPRLTPVPVVQGPQTATVVPEEGQESEEISTDQHGRVKVRFHWNRPDQDMDGKNQQERSCWIRVSHPWAGRGWGALAIPRIGQEVIVDFEEGHTDRPIITGRVYNGEQKPPYDLPGGKNTSGIKSDSTKGGGGYNEIAMDDTKNKELIRIHAQHDMSTTVRHDQTTSVFNNQTVFVKKQQGVTVEELDATLDVGKGNRKVTVHEKNYELNTATAEIKFDAKTNLDGKAGDQAKLHVGNNYIKIDQSTIEEKADSTITLQVGSSQIIIEKAKITLAAGSGQIVLDKAGVTINGQLVKIN